MTEKKKVDGEGESLMNERMMMMMTPMVPIGGRVGLPVRWTTDDCTVCIPSIVL